MHNQPLLLLSFALSLVNTYLSFEHERGRKFCSLIKTLKDVSILSSFVSSWAVDYLMIRVYVDNFVASLCLQVLLYSANSLRMVRQAGMSSTLGQGVVEECTGASWYSTSWRKDMQTSSVCSCSIGSCHWGSNKSKMGEGKEKKHNLTILWQHSFSFTHLRLVVWSH